MPKLILTTEAQGKVRPPESSAAPAGFGNGPPFRRDALWRDPVGLAVLSIAAIAALTFLGSMIAVLVMHAP